jgi:hypothetical protein
MEGGSGVIKESIMFAYSDPTGTGLLQQVGALEIYREAVDRLHHLFHSERDSAFTLREAFDELAAGTQAETGTVEWKAFPVTAGEPPASIDGDRFRLQDEYVEWRVEKRADGSLAAVTFITEFTEYYEALAQVGAAALKEEIKRLNPGANATDRELFGDNFDPDAASPRARAARFVRHLRRNPWNNGERGILCLTHGSNTMGALFGLLGACGVPKNVDPTAMCGSVGDACVPGRNSDPAVCSTAQRLASANRSFAPQDPCGIRIEGLDRAGRWTIDGQVVDINAPAGNRGVWTIVRNGRRAVFKFQGDVRLDGARVETGAQLATQLTVAAALMHAPNSALPEWARPGNEPVRAPIV